MPNYDKLTLEEILRSLNKGSNSVRGGGSGYGAGYIPPVVPVVLLNNPIIAGLGPSTMQMHNAYAGDRVYSKANGPINWAIALGANAQFYVWRDSGNTRGYKGFNWGYNSARISDQNGGVAPQNSWLSEIIASDAQILLWETGRGSGDADSGRTVDQYLDPMKAGFLAAKAAGKTCIWVTPWLRDTSVGGDWASGGFSRSYCASVRTQGMAWCAANGVNVLDAYMIMGDGTADNNPKSTYAAADGIHYASPGAVAVGRALKTLLDSLTTAKVAYNPADAANLFPYQSFTGTGGGLTNSALGVAPDNMTLGRGTGTNARSVTGSKETISSRDYEVITIGSSGTVPATGEGCVLRMTTFPATNLFTVGTWVEGRCIVKSDGWAGFTGYRLILEDGAATPIGGAGMTAAAGTDGDTPVTAFSLADQQNIRAGQADDLEIRSMPFQVTNTGLTMRLILTYTNGSGGGVVKTASWDARVITDPNTFL